MRLKGLSIFIRPLLEVALLLIGGSILAMSLFHLAGFRGMDHRYAFINTAEAKAGWLGVAGDRGNHIGQSMEAGGRGESKPENMSIGDPKRARGMIITANYTPMISEFADIHLEAHINAAEGNAAGFGAGEFIPNLAVKCSLKKLKTGEELEGYLFQATVDPDDQRYYDKNLKMAGAGDYELSMTVVSSAVGSSDEQRAKSRYWKKPVVVSWKFTYEPEKR